MDWQQHLQERAARYADIARSAADPRRRVQAKLTAGEYQAALTVCNTTEPNPTCCFAPGHWILTGCRRARTGSCAIVFAPASEADPQDDTRRVA